MSTKENEIKETPEKAVVKPVGPPKSTAREYFESFVITLVMAIFGMTFILQAVTVPTGSMQNTILVGDYLLVKNLFSHPRHRFLSAAARDPARRYHSVQVSDTSKSTGR